jgi:HlyD family secretion protein
MKGVRPEIRYSEPVREIMGNPPASILRWGNIALFVLFLLFILFSWLIKYPDKIPSPVEITTMNPPATLVTKITGRIKTLNVGNRDSVKAGQLLAVMETTASTDEIYRLGIIIDSTKNSEELRTAELPSLSRLGELQSYYAGFLKKQSDYESFITNDYYGNKIESITREIAALDEYIKRIAVKEKLYSENLSLERKKFRRDSLLYVNKVIPESELEISHQAFIRTNIELQQVRLDFSEKSIESAQKHQLLRDYQINKTTEREKYLSDLREAFLILKAEFNIWENSYLLRSPCDGLVTFTKFWTENQVVMKDEPVLNVIPFETGSYLGRIKLKMLRSGKVKQGQMVNIKLSSFPYMEYGMLRGIIKSKSMVPSGDAYIIEIELPDGLTTLYGKKLEFTQNMSGTAEILTEDQRLLQKMINPLRYLISNNKR